MREEVDEALPLFEERGWLEDPASYHRTPPPPAGIRTRRKASGAIRFTTMTWPGRLRVPVRRARSGALRRVTGRTGSPAPLLFEHRSGDRPWVVCIHGFGMGSPAVDLRTFRALHLHRELGLNVAFMTLPLHGPRKPAGARLAGMPGADMLDSLHGMAQAVWDVRQLLAHLRERGDGPIAVMGFSLGGCVTALVASLDDIDAALLLAPAVDLGTLMVDAADRFPGSAIAVSSDGIERASAVLHPVAPLRLTGRVPPERAMIAAATLDRFARPSTQAVALWRHWNEPELHWTHGGHVGLVMGRRVQTAIDGALDRFGLVIARA